MDRTVNIFQTYTVEEQSTFDIGKLTEQYKQHRSTDWSIPEAFLCLLLSAAFADGNLSPEELDEIYALAGRSRALKSLSADDLGTANNIVNERLQNRPNGLQEACETLPTDMRLPIFAHCVDIVLADGELMQTEADFLDRVVTMLGLDPADAQRVMEVMLVKNRF